MTTETIPCRLCGLPTPMLGTELCDRCWELETRIEHDPALAMKILKPASDNKQAAFEAMREALRLILPMAKGYANAHDVGNNWQFVEQAEAVLALADSIQNEEP